MLASAIFIFERIFFVLIYLDLLVGVEAPVLGTCVNSSSGSGALPACAPMAQGLNDLRLVLSF
jgi:hypothetical protein